MRQILYFILKILAGAILKKYHPKIIGVTGSMGKTSTKEAIFAVLSSRFNIGRNTKNYNNEIGVPLTILGAESGGRSPFAWLAVFWRGIKMIFGKVNYPEVLILEMGADKPGDIKYLMSFVDIDIGLITGIGEIPVHVEFFESPAQVAREKFRLIEFLKNNDFAILNFDDERVKNLSAKTKAKVFGYGFDEAAAIKAVDFQLNIGFDVAAAGLSFKIEAGGKKTLINCEGVFSRHQVYPMLAGAAVGLAMGLDLSEIVSGLKNYQSPPGRLNLLEGIKKSWILDDTYNASPSSTLAALEALSQFEGRRKIAVLGDMLELGRFTEEAHRKIGQKAARIVDLFFAVGERMKFAVDEAQKNGLPAKSIFHFDVSEEAGLPLQNLMQKGDMILIKGSQSMRMEKIVEEIMAEPDKAGELLVRQNKKWKNR